MCEKSIFQIVPASFFKTILAIFFVVGNWPTIADGASKCIQEDGSITYSEFGCKKNTDDREDIRFWDSDEKSYQPQEKPDKGVSGESQRTENKDEKRPEEPEDSIDRKSQYGINASRHPCNNDGGSVVEQRLAAKACAVLKRIRGKEPDSCKDLAAGRGLFNANVSEYKLAIKKCQAASGQRID